MVREQGMLRNIWQNGSAALLVACCFVAVLPTHAALGADAGDRDVATKESPATLKSQLDAPLLFVKRFYVAGFRRQ